MRHRLLGSAIVVAAAAILVATAGIAGAQSGDDNAWEPARTADGQPDISGVWTNFDPTPFEAPDDVDLDRLAPLAAWFPGSNRPQRAPAMPTSEADRRRPPQGPWGDGPGSAPRNERRRSMVVDPPNGRIPVRDHAPRDARLQPHPPDRLVHEPYAVGAVHHPRGARGDLPARLRRRLPDSPDAGLRRHPLRDDPRGADHPDRRPPFAVGENTGAGTGRRAAAGKETPWSSRWATTIPRARSPRTSPRGARAVCRARRTCGSWSGSRARAPIRWSTR